MSGRDTILSCEHVKDLIARGHTIVIVNGKVLKVDAWLPYHPGGDKIILHVVGRDATDEVNALHTLQVQKRMNAFQIGKIEGRWKNFLPPIQGGKFRTLEDSATMQDYIQEPEEVDNLSESSRDTDSMSDDVDDIGPSTMRRRKARYSSASATSESSVDEDLPQNVGFSPMDARTKLELDSDLAKYPSLDHTTQDDIVHRYRQLDGRIQAEGLYQCRYTAYLYEIIRYALLFSITIFLLKKGWYLSSAFFLGIFWHQLVFTAHDAGHIAITHNYTADTFIGIIVADFIGGLSLGWWKRSHYIHHIVTNSPEHDPDIEQMPFFALSHRFFESLTSSYYDRVMVYDAFAKIVVKYQHLLYYPVLTLGRFNLYRLSWEHLLLHGPRKGPAAWHRWLEIAGQLFFWTWFGYGVLGSIPTLWGKVAYVMISHMVTAPLHVQITLSHYAMSTSDLGVDESFPQKMSRTTMDVDCPEWLDFIHGGLQFQAIHHLYPRMPRHNLRRAQKLVQEFCNEVKIPYALYGFVKGNKEVIGRLGEIGQQARILSECQRKAAETPFAAH